MNENKPKNENEEMKYYTDPEIRGTIDSFLHDITCMESSMGIDSTLDEKERFVAWKQEVYLKIKSLDPLFYIRLKPSAT